MKIRWNEFFLGPAKDPTDSRVFKKITLVALFAWVGLGADGLSSSCYGPEVAFLELGEHRYLAIALAGVMAITVCLISASYAQLIEVFPSGGGGYLATSKILGKGPGVVCGSALVLDYILTIAISVSAGVEALFSFDFIPDAWWEWKAYVTVVVLILLILLNLRGVKESILVLLPIFLVFVLTHVIGILITLFGHATEIPALFGEFPQQVSEGVRSEGGWLALLAIFFTAYSRGAGTYTGIEAVSNSMQILREPRVATGKRTMLYMAISLAFTASGLLLGYLLLEVNSTTGKTLNAVFFGKIFGEFNPGGIPLGGILVAITLLSEGALLFVAAQAGYIGGPRTLATMALDRWVPTRFSHLSNRLVVQDGVIFMGAAAVAFVIFSGADVKKLVVFYSIIVFLTFTLSQLGMCIHWIRSRSSGWIYRLTINGTGLVITLGLLIMMVIFNFIEKDGWIILVITLIGVVICYLVRYHYEKVSRNLKELDMLLEVPPTPRSGPPAERALGGPHAVLLVSGFNGLGMHSFLTILRLFPAHFKNFIFISVGQVDYEEFKGVEEIANLRKRTVDSLEKYVEWARSMGLYAEHRHAIGTDLVTEIEGLAQGIGKDFPGSIFFAGQLVFEHENFFTRSLHSQSAFEIQRRLQFQARPVVLLPIRIHPMEES